MPSFCESFDATVWVKAWLETIAAHPDVPTDEGTMIGWFANALMRGYDERARRYPESARSVVETRPEAKALNDARREGYYAALVDREEEDFGQKVSARYREMYREEAAKRFPSENAHAT